jgi:hypothetical protein
MNCKGYVNLKNPHDSIILHIKSFIILVWRRGWMKHGDGSHASYGEEEGHLHAPQFGKAFAMKLRKGKEIVCRM